MIFALKIAFFQKFATKIHYLKNKKGTTFCIVPFFISKNFVLLVCFFLKCIFNTQTNAVFG